MQPENVNSQYLSSVRPVYQLQENSVKIVNKGADKEQQCSQRKMARMNSRSESGLPALNQIALTSPK